jgi:hypothetical protein
MGTIVVKPDRDRDLYVGWSSIVEAPVWWGPRAEVLQYLADDHRGRSDDAPEARLARADEAGTSAYDKRDGGWDDEGFVYEQRGWLPRTKLIPLCEALQRGDESAAWDLLEPFDDETEVRRG